MSLLSVKIIQEHIKELLLLPAIIKALIALIFINLIHQFSYQKDVILTHLLKEKFQKKQ